MLTELVREERSQALEHRAPIEEPESSPEPIHERVSGVHATSSPPPPRRKLWIAAAAALVAVSAAAFALSRGASETPAVEAAALNEPAALEPATLEADDEPVEELHAGTAVVPVTAPAAQPASTSDVPKPNPARPAPKAARPRKAATAATQSASKPKTPAPLQLQPNPY